MFFILFLHVFDSYYFFTHVSIIIFIYVFYFHSQSTFTAFCSIFSVQLCMSPRAIKPHCIKRKKEKTFSESKTISADLFLNMHSVTGVFAHTKYLFRGKPNINQSITENIKCPLKPGYFYLHLVLGIFICTWHLVHVLFSCA